jgi:hypothetical protein
MRFTALSRILTLVSVAALVCSGAAFGQNSKDQQSAPKLSIQKLDHSFGEIKKGSVARHDFIVKNEGSADLEIKSVVPSCGCTASDFTKIIPPGQEGKITLIFNSVGFSGAVTKHAEVYTNDPARPQITLMMNMIVASDEAARGRQVGPFMIGPSPEWMSRAPKGSSANGLITLTNTTAQPIKITKFDPNGAAFTATLQTLEDGKRYAASFVSAPTLPVGSHKQTLKLTTDSKDTPEIVLNLEVIVAPAVTVNPQSLTFDNVPVSSPDAEITLVSKFLWVRSGTGGGLEIKSMTSDLPFVKVKIESMEGSSIALRVGFSEKPQVGSYTGKIKIETNNSDVKILEVPITVNAK